MVSGFVAYSYVNYYYLIPIVIILLYYFIFDCHGLSIIVFTFSSY